MFLCKKKDKIYLFWFLVKKKIHRPFIFFPLVGKNQAKKMNASCFLFDQEKQQPIFFRREDGKDDRAHVYLFFCSLSMS